MELSISRYYITNLHHTHCKNYVHYIHYLQTLSKRCSRNLQSLILIALRAAIRITAPKEDMSNYENKQIPQKTGLASYLVSKSHGSEVRNCSDQRVFSPLVTIAASPLNFHRKPQEKNSLAPRVHNAWNYAISWWAIKKKRHSVHVLGQLCHNFPEIELKIWNFDLMFQRGMYLYQSCLLMIDFIRCQWIWKAAFSTSSQVEGVLGSLVVFSCNVRRKINPGGSRFQTVFFISANDYHLKWKIPGSL